MKIYKNKKGFTLLEIILTITAIGMLSSIVLVALNPNRQLESARSVKRKADMDIIAKAVEQYVVNNRGKYPPSLQSVVTGGTVGLCVTSPCVGGIDLTNDLAPYIATIPLPDIGQYTITKTATGITPGYDSSTIWATAGTTAPKLDLNFARDKQLVNAVNGSNPITFTRASTSTYTGSDGLIKTAAANEARFDHDPVTKSSLGLLIEEQRINLLINSSNYTGTGVNVAIEANSILAPDGTQTAELITGNVGTSTKRVGKAVSTSTTGVYTTSVFVKAGTENFVVLRMNDNTGLNGTRQRFNLSTGSLDGAVVNDGANIGGFATITAYPNGWYRLTVTGTFVNALTSIQAGQVWLNNYAGNALTTTFYVWGGQLELGAFPTSYIPTAGAPVTRFQDNANITGTNFTNFYTDQTQASWYVLGKSNAPIVSGITRRFFEVIDGIGNNRYFLGYNTPTTTRLVSTAAISVADITATGNLTNGVRIASGYQTNNYNQATNGVLGSLDDSGAMPTVNQLILGNDMGTAGAMLNGTISRLIYWNTRLSDETLTNITK
jgi:prepilin-type N-terminal cleavage/methylation domain-containing protein